MSVDVERRRQMDRERQRRWRAANAEQYRVSRREKYQVDSAPVLRGMQARATRLHDEVFGYYGRTCQCCGALRDLSIDHINGDGAEHRRVLYGGSHKGGGVRFYAWLKRNHFPSGYQTLCRQCNRSKSNGPKCRLH